MFRQLGAVLGPSVLGTIVTTRFPHYLEDRLTSTGVPAPAASHITEGAVHGGTATSLPPALARTVADSAARAFTDAVHLGLVIGAIALLTMAIPTAPSYATAMNRRARTTTAVPGGSLLCATCAFNASAARFSRPASRPARSLGL
jgi:hypothetical protein